MLLPGFQLCSVFGVLATGLTTSCRWLLRTRHAGSLITYLTPASGAVIMLELFIGLSHHFCKMVLQLFPVYRAPPVQTMLRNY